MKLAEPFLSQATDRAWKPLLQAVMKIAKDPSPRVRFQVALGAGYLPPPSGAQLLAQVLTTDGADPWTQTAVLSSAVGANVHDLIGRITTGKPELATDVKLPVLSRLAAIIGARGEQDEIARLLSAIASGNEISAPQSAALLAGVGQGMRNTKTPLSAWLAHPPKGSEEAVARLRERFERATMVLRDTGASPVARVGVANLLALG